MCNIIIHCILKFNSPATKTARPWMMMMPKDGNFTMKASIYLLMQGSSSEVFCTPENPN